MRNASRFAGCVLLLSILGYGATKPHVVSFGRWIQIRLSDDGEESAAGLKVRALMVDGHTKEIVSGLPHDVTEKNFVVQSMFRFNDSLPQEVGALRWQWERGGWLVVNRETGKVQALSLAAFDAETSSVNWVRDYAAYCGLSDDGKKSFVVVMQLGRRKPLLKRALTNPPESAGEICPAPRWERAPARVTFAPKNEARFTYTVSSRAIGVVLEEENQEASDE